VLAAPVLDQAGCDAFVEAVRVLRKRGVAGRFLIVGEAGPGVEIGEALEREDIGWWHFDAAREVYAGAHVVVVPASAGNVNRVLVDAAACARPVVMVGGAGEPHVLHVSCGEGRELADVLQHLAEDPLLRWCFGIQGRRRAEVDFSVDAASRQALAVYDALLLPTAVRRLYPFPTQSYPPFSTAPQETAGTGVDIPGRYASQLLRSAIKSTRGIAAVGNS
jgi:glycosyltransferase involved in cell wall biosynthesis